MYRLPFARVRYAALCLLLALPACSREPAADTEADVAQQPGTDAVRDTVALQGLGYSLGSPDAPVTVVEFSDFGCPYCARFALQTLPELKREFIETGQVRWQYVPFVLGMFPNGDLAARASECAGEQERFWPMHDLIYENQREWKQTENPEQLFARLAREAGLDARRFTACFQENGGAERTARNNEAATTLGIRATPSFLVNGRPVEGALPLEQFRMLLQWAGATPGTPPGS